MLKYYICRYYLNAQHSSSKIEKNSHQHTFTFAISIHEKVESGMVPFFEIDATINKYLMQYKGIYLNSLPQFQGRYPSIEWIGEVFYDDLGTLLAEKGQTCLQLEVSENPLKTFLISDKIMLVSRHPRDSQRTWDTVLERRNMYVNLINKLKEGL